MRVILRKQPALVSHGGWVYGVEQSKHYAARRRALQGSTDSRVSSEVWKPPLTRELA